jgi:ribosomal protein L37AE/L43A
MLALILAPLKPPLQPIWNDRLSIISQDQSMVKQHSCPCCSNILLRHMRLGTLYWRCSHCHQAMPVWTSS